MPAAFHGVHLEIVEAPWAADERGLHRLPAYSIAKSSGSPVRRVKLGGPIRGRYEHFSHPKEISMYRRTLALAFVSVLAPLSLALTQDAPRQSPNATKLPEVRLSAQRHLTPSCGGRAPYRGENSPQ